MNDIELKEPTKVMRTDTVEPKAVNDPVDELFEMIKKLKSRVDEMEHLLYEGSGVLDALKVGFMMYWPVATLPSNKWMFTNGNILPVNDYPQLFAVLGYKFGGNGSTTFAIPYLAGEFIRVWNNIGSGADIGRVLGSWQNDAIRNIYGRFGYYRGGSDGAFYQGSGLWEAIKGGSTTNTTLYFDASRVVPVAGENRPANRAFPFIIKIK